MVPIIERLSDLTLGDIGVLRSDGEHVASRIVHRLVEDWGNGANRFDRPGEALFGAWIERQLVGVCGLNIDPYADDDRVGRVRHLYVSSACRRLGIGRQLVERVLRVARGRFEVLHLRTNNPVAARLYESTGFDACAESETCTHIVNLAAR